MNLSFETALSSLLLFQVIIAFQFDNQILCSQVCNNHQNSYIASTSSFTHRETTHKN